MAPPIDTNYEKKKDSVVIDVSRALARALQLDDDTNHHTTLSRTDTKNPADATIFKAPWHLRSQDEATYKPQLVSIGPYHHNTLNDDAGNAKLEFLHHLTYGRRRRPVADNLRKYAGIAYTRLAEAKKQYQASEIDHIGDEEFVKMLVLDGCFIIEFLTACYLNDRMMKSEAVKAKLPVIRSDLLLVENQMPFFILEEFYKASSFGPELNKDCVGLMELALVYLSGNRDGAQMAVKYYKEIVTSKRADDNDNNEPNVQIHHKETTITKRGVANNKPMQIHHLLHLYHSMCLNPEFAEHVNMKLSWTQREKVMATSFIPFFLIFRLFRSVCGFISACFRPLFEALHWLLSKLLWLKKAVMRYAFVAPFRHLALKYGLFENLIGGVGGSQHLTGIPKARYLQDIGFTFKAKQPLSSFSYVTQKGMTIEIPALSLYSTPLAVLKNLVAYELRLNCGQQSFFIAYAMLMDCLIDAAEDVAVLREYGIIDKGLGDDEEVASFFNRLCDNNDMDNQLDGVNDHYLQQMFDDVGEYQEKKYHRVKLHQWRKKLTSGDYFSNAWAVPSMTAAFLIILLTAASTVYTVLPYYQPPLQRFSIPAVIGGGPMPIGNGGGSGDAGGGYGSGNAGGYGANSSAGGGVGGGPKPRDNGGAGGGNGTGTGGGRADGGGNAHAHAGAHSNVSVCIGGCHAGGAAGGGSGGGHAP